MPKIFIRLHKQCCCNCGMLQYACADFMAMTATSSQLKRKAIEGLDTGCKCHHKLTEADLRHRSACNSPAAKSCKSTSSSDPSSSVCTYSVKLSRSLRMPPPCSLLGNWLYPPKMVLSSAKPSCSPLTALKTSLRQQHWVQLLCTYCG